MSLDYTPTDDAPVDAPVRGSAPSALLAAALTQLTEGVIVTDARGRIQFVNDAAARLHGAARLGIGVDEYASSYQLLTEDGRPYPSRELPLARAVLRGETVVDARWRIRRPDDTEIVAVGCARPVLDATGARVGAVLTLRDDTPRAEASLTARRAAEVLERVADAHVMFDRELRYVAVNAAAERSTGRSREEILGRTLLEVFPEAAGSESEQQYHRVLAERREVHFAEHYVGDDLDNHIEVDAYPTDDGGIAVFWREVNERVRAEEALRESEARYRALFESIDAGFCIIEVAFDDANRPRDYLFVDANPAFERQTGLVDAIGKTARELVPDLEEHWFETYGRVAATGEPTRLQQGSQPMGRWFDVYAFRIGRPDDRRVAVLFTDITAAKTAEREREQLVRALEIERERLAMVFAHSPSMLALVRGPEHILELANEAYLQLIGRRDVIGRPLLEAVPELRGQGFEKLLDAVRLTGEPFVGREVPTWVARGSDMPAEERYFDFVYLPVTEVDGTRSGVIAHGTDVTEKVHARREVERARDRANRLQALTAALASARTVEDVAAVIVAEAVAAMDAATGVLAVRSPDENGGVVVRQTGLRPELLSPGSRFLLDHPGPAARCLRTGEPQWAETRDELDERYPEMREVWEELGTHALATAPLTVAGATVGAMSFTWTAPRALSPEDRAFFLALGRQAAQAVERARLAEAEREAREALHEREAIARERLAELEAIYDSTPVGLCVLDRDLRFVRINEQLAEINGLPAAAHLGRTVREVVPAIAVVAEASLRRVLETGEPALDVEIVGQTRARPGVTRTWIEQWLPIRDAEGRITGLNIVAEEVTAERAAAAERERLLAAAERSRAEAEAANRAKSDFLAVMSHELRTPLNAIGGYAELMEMGIRGPVTPQQAEDLRRIQASQRHLLGLVNEVLNYARIETGSVHYDITDVSLAAVVATVEPLVAPQLSAKGLAYAVSMCDPAPVARADREKVRQVLLNLLSNAIKFTDEGGRVDVSCERHGDRVLVRVRDTGIGIAPHELTRVFEPFVQVNASLTRTQEGTGLGLAISRDLARGMGGDLAAESEPGRGSTFTLSLPAA